MEYGGQGGSRDAIALYCCFTAALLLLYCCFTAALLLLYCCFTAAILLLMQAKWRARRE